MIMYEGIGRRGEPDHACYRLVFVINYMTSWFHHVPLLLYVYCSVYGSRYTEYYSRYPEPQTTTIPGELYTILLL